MTLEWQAAIGREAGELEDLLAGVKRSTSSGETEPKLQYAPLGAFLRLRTEAELRLKLSEIATILGRELPQEAWTPQFWANASDHHQTRRGQWLDAGYRAFFERRTESVLFRKTTSDAFRLEEPTDDPEELRSRTQAAKHRMELATDGSMPPPPGSTVPEQRTSLSMQYVRDPNVIAWVLVGANGVCEACDGFAPFTNMDDEPFLEVHHVRPLGEGGPDVVENAVAACPNCHRRFHFGKDRDVFRTATITKIGRLKDYSKKTDGPSTVGRLVPLSAHTLEKPLKI